MIRVEYRRSGRGFELEMSGHAGYASEPGTDIVCAGASALVFGLIGWLDTTDRVKGRPEIVTAPGLARVRARGGRCVREAFRQAVAGLRMLEKKYPQCVAVSCRNGDGECDTLISPGEPADTRESTAEGGSPNDEMARG